MPVLKIDAHKKHIFGRTLTNTNIQIKQTRTTAQGKRYKRKCKIIHGNVQIPISYPTLRQLGIEENEQPIRGQQ